MEKIMAQGQALGAADSWPSDVYLLQLHND